MIPVVPQPEPTDFEEKVRTPGKAYLLTVPNPTTQQFKTHAFWTKVSHELRQAYRGICAYSCHFVPHDVGWVTTEHFKPKDIFPQDAYEWSNYRFVSGVLNRYKGTQEILDPFVLAPESFIIQFPSLLVKVGSGMLPAHVALAEHTINLLKLNAEGGSLDQRIHYMDAYCLHGVPFNYLQQCAPFLAYELTRQNLVDNIRNQWIPRSDPLETE